MGSVRALAVCPSDHARDRARKGHAFARQLVAAGAAVDYSSVGLPTAEALRTLVAVAPWMLVTNARTNGPHAMRSQSL